MYGEESEPLQPSELRRDDELLGPLAQELSDEALGVAVP